MLPAGTKVRTSHHPTAWSREVWQGKDLSVLPCKDQKGPLLFRPALELFQIQTLGNLIADRTWVHMGTFVVFFLVRLSVRHFSGKEKLFLGSRPLCQKVVNLVLKL